MIKSLIFLILYTILPFHDFHVSHTTLHYNNAQELIEITVRVAIDDLEKTLETKSSGKLKLGSPKENISSNQYIKNYFDHHLQISINKKMTAYNWIGKEIAKDLHDVYLYFEITDCNSNGNIESIAIENTLFLESSHKQTNIVLIEFGDINYNLNFNKDYIRETIVF
tara:strand:+ start:100 stop:600 length:501 start_codon:yes stop_codon:yes gene_type:complete